MQIERLRLLNFRNFHKREFEFGKGLNLIYGENGTGKTNLIEAIAYLSLPRSFRRARDRDLIRWNESFFMLEGFIKSYDIQHKLKVSLSPDGKSVMIDEKNITSLKELFRTFVVLVFSPKEHYWIDGPPVVRRKLMDWFISILDPLYFENLLRYKRNLAQKNALLKNGNAEPLARIWNRKLEETGQYIIKRREEVAVILNDSVKRNNLLEMRVPSIKYVPSIELEEGILDSKLKEERERGFSLYGPHRDRIEFLLDGKPPQFTASEGEKRLLLLSFILTLREELRKNLGCEPVLCLDEPTSILSKKYVNNLLNRLQGQVFITSVNPLEIEGKKIYLSWRE
jgi:DNA replication and repair protein RecF